MWPIVCEMVVYDANGEMMNTYKIVVGKSEKKRPLGRPRHRLTNSMEQIPS